MFLARHNPLPPFAFALVSKTGEVMLPAEFVVVSVPCELNRSFFLSPKKYLVARSTKLESIQ